LKNSAIGSVGRLLDEPGWAVYLLFFLFFGAFAASRRGLSGCDTWLGWRDTEIPRHASQILRSRGKQELIMGTVRASQP